MQPNDLTAKLKASAPGQTAEETNSATSVAGLYRHPLSGAEVITLSDPLYGDAQSEAALRVGFVRVRDTEPGEIVQINLVEEVTNNRNSGLANSSDDIKGLLARVNAQDAEIARLKGDNPDANQASEVPGGEQAKVDGAAAVNSQASTTDLAPLNGVSGDTSTTAPVEPVNPADASVTGGADAPKEPVGGPATGQPVAPTPSTDGLKDAGSVEAQAASAAAAAGEAPKSPEVPVSASDASNATPVANTPADENDDDNTPDGASTLPLTEQSTDELKETASAEGLDAANLNTNEDLIAAIEAKRAESEK